MSIFLLNPGGITHLRPSMCSNSCGSTFAFIGSKMKSMPSRRANFAAGTKSASPEKSTIVSTNFFNDNEAMSTPIFMSILFCLIFRNTSFSVKSPIIMEPFNSSFTFDGYICQWPLSFNDPNHKATFRFLFKLSNSPILKAYSPDLAKSITFFERGPQFCVRESCFSSCFQLVKDSW